MGAFALGFGSPTDPFAQSSDAVGNSPFLVGLDGADSGNLEQVPVEAAPASSPVIGATTPTESLGFPTIQTPSIAGSSFGSTIGNLISTGLSAWKTKMGTDLLQSQINHGQTPSVVFDTNGNPSGPFTITKAPGGVSTITAGSAAATALGGLSGSLILFLVIGGVILFALTRR